MELNEYKLLIQQPGHSEDLSSSPCLPFTLSSPHVCGSGH